MLSQFSNIRIKTPIPRPAVAGARPPAWSQTAAARRGDTERAVFRFRGAVNRTTPSPRLRGEGRGKGLFRAPEQRRSAHSPTLRLVDRHPHPARKSAPTSPRVRGEVRPPVRRCVKTDRLKSGGLRSPPCPHAGAARRRNRKRNRFPVRRGLRSAGCDLCAASAGSPTMAC
jgi:hypothetical protein